MKDTTSSAHIVHSKASPATRSNLNREFDSHYQALHAKVIDLERMMDHYKLELNRFEAKSSQQEQCIEQLIKMIASTNQKISHL